MGLFDFFKRKDRIDLPGDMHEFCPRCEANITLQKGYDNSLPYWICKGCGEMLINPEVDATDDIAWICDECGSMLNVQQGFAEDCGQWKCVECGFINTIDDSELYLSEDEYKMALCDPYKGMADEDIVQLMCYEEVECVDGREDIFVVKDDKGQLFVRKFLSTFDESVYRFLIDNPIENIPRIIAAFKSDNFLVVIEEFIEGKTISDYVKQDVIEYSKALRITGELCKILKSLHTLPKPLIHRDIKPSNVMIADDGRVVLLDVNVAKWYKPDQIEDTRMLGTLYYAAPEQMGYGFYSSSEKADIYAVGVLLNVMLTGKIPKEERARGVAWSLIEKCICLNPDERFSDGELLAKVDELLSAF